MIFGKDLVFGGKVYFDGKDIIGMFIVKVIENGINYVFEDRW